MTVDQSRFYIGQNLTHHRFWIGLKHLLTGTRIKTFQVVLDEVDKI